MLGLECQRDDQPQDRRSYRRYQFAIYRELPPVSVERGLGWKDNFRYRVSMAEVLKHQQEKVEQSDVLQRLSLEENRYILLSAHREENIDNEDNFISLMTAINDIAQKYEMPIIYSTHPRSKKFIDKRQFKFHPLVRSMQPFGFSDYVKLQRSSYCVLSDSGTLSEESAILGFASVLIRTSTERPEALDAGSVVVGGITARDIEQALDLAVAMRENGEESDAPKDYLVENVSMKVIKIIQSYTEIVNLTVWGKR